MQNGDKDGKALCKLINTVVYGKKENLRNRFDVRFVSNKKDYLKRTFKPNYMSHEILDNNFSRSDLIRKITDILTLNKTRSGMCILEFSKVLMYEFPYDYIKNKYSSKNSRLLFTNTDSLMSEIKIENDYENLSNDKEMFDCSN